MLTLQQLITPVTEDQALASALTILGQMGFQATSWQSGSIQLTMLRLFARVWAAFSTTLQQIAAGGFTSLAGSGEIANTSAFLRLLATYVYDITPLAANATIGNILLTSSAAAPLATWSAGDITVSDRPSGTAGANTFTVQVGGSLGPGSSVSVSFKADSPGAASNIPPNTTLYLWTPLVGITASNPALSPSTTWITTPGQDDESDARLAARCIAKWSRLTYGNINGAYEGWSFEALPALTRVTVASALGNGTVTIVGANSLGPISGADCTTIANYLNGVTDGKGRRPLNDIVSVIPATSLAPTYTPTLNVTPEVKDTIAATVTQALLAYAGTVPIGGFRLTGSGGIVPFAALINIAQSTPGVRSLSGFPVADIPLASSEIFTPTFVFSVNQVAPGA